MSALEVVAFGHQPRISVEQIASLYRERRDLAGAQMSAARMVQRMYNGDVVVPLPEITSNEQPAIPNRVREGLKQISNRVSSAMPNLIAPPTRFGFKVAEDRARDRRRAWLGWWEFTNMRVVLRQRARFLLGYASAPVEVRWNRRLGVPCWEPLNPLTTFCAPLTSVTQMCPADAITEQMRPLSWLRSNYPDKVGLVFKDDPDRRSDPLFTLLTYTDDYECVLLVAGKSVDQFDSDTQPGSHSVELERYPNRAGVCPVVVPRTVSLDRPHGQFDGLYGMYQTEAMLMALAIHATRKGVFADEWLINPNDAIEPRVIQIPDSMTGEPGIAVGGTLQPRGVDPQFQTNMTMDRLAESQRMQAGLSSELSGVAPSNVRTGRRAAQLLSATIDFTIQESQEAFELSLIEENKIAVAFAKGYDDGQARSFYVSWKGARGHLTYKTSEVFDSDANVVSYALAGTDGERLVVEGGQRVGMGTLSKRSFMELDPLIDDAEAEDDRIVAEGLKAAVLAAIQQQASTGELPVVDAARITELVITGRLELFEAIATVQKEAQERQAAQVPAGAPEAQPGLSMPGMGAESIPEPVQSQQNLNSLLMSLRGPQMGLAG